jgi:hypothetical protein
MKSDSFLLAQLRAILRFAQWSYIVDDPLEQGDVNVAMNTIEGSIKSFRDPESIHPHADYFGQM